MGDQPLILAADKFAGQVVVITLCAAVKAGFLYQPVKYIVTEGGVAAVFTGQADDPSGSIVFHTARQPALRGTDGLSLIVCAEMDEQWGYVGAKSRQRWLFYAYDSLRKTVVAHVFGERTMATLGRLMSLLSPFDVVIWMTDGWPLYESRPLMVMGSTFELPYQQVQDIFADGTIQTE